MKDYSRYITLAGGVLALLSFALPWESDYSGVEYANMSFNFITLVFLASLVIIGTSLVLNRRERWKANLSRVLVFISSGFGICCFVVLFFGEGSDLKIESTWFDRIEYGVFLNVIGFILAIVGVWTHPKTSDISESNDE